MPADAFATTGSKFTLDQTGLQKVTLNFIIARGSAEDDDEPWDVLAAFQPAKPPGNMKEIDRSAGKRDDGDWDLQINYGGGDETRFKEQVELDHAGAEDPVETFPAFRELAKKYNAKFDPQDPAKFDGWNRTLKEKGRDGKPLPNPLYGFSTSSMTARFCASRSI